MDDQLKPQRWMKMVLVAAGIYNLLWGLVVVGIPGLTLRWLGFDPVPIYPQLWQCIGMIVGVYGIGYLIAASDPYRHWPIVLVGLLGKIFGPIGFLISVISGTLPAQVGMTILTNDLIWWVPFTIIVWRGIRSSQAEGTMHAVLEYDDPVRELESNDGRTLEQLSSESPRLVVFLRQAGCTFCRASLARLAKERESIEEKGFGIVLVHLGNDPDASKFFERYGLDDLPRISDPNCRLYRQFGLDLGTFRELFGIRVWVRGVVAGVFQKHGIGRTVGNAFQMPGAFVIHCGDFIRGFKPVRASEPFDYLKLVEEASRDSALACPA